MNAKFDAVLKAPFGALGVRTEDDAIIGIVFLPPQTGTVAPGNPLAAKACGQFAAYLVDPAAKFDLPLRPSGTEFQKRVWKSIAAIPGGRTLTYGDIAKKLHSAPRAVGQACGRNPFPLVVPCHRVLATGGLGGFARERGGFFLDVKRWLLEHEGVL